MTRNPLPLAVALVVLPLAAFAQQAATVSGHVTSGGAPLAGAHVRVEELRPPIDRVTDADGRYSFVVPSANVRGQAVRITASMEDRRTRYAPKTAVVLLSGGAITQDFELTRLSGEVGPEAEDTSSRTGARRAPRAVLEAGDTVGLADFAGVTDIASALAGRVPGLLVVAPPTPGGSASLTFRGPRSLIGASNQPLFVLDGVPLDNTVFTSSAQRFGLGGFDYGSPLGDLNLADVSSWRWLDGAEGAARYGGRAANGVVLLTTKNGTGGPAIAIEANAQSSTAAVRGLPELQNQFGQGLDGKFSFFNGAGAGVNDAVDQSWGPPLDGRPLAQASYTQPKRPDIRLWTPQPENVNHYFRSARNTNTNAAVQGSSQFGSFRFFVGNQDIQGETPLDHVVLREGAAHGTVAPGALTLSTNVAITDVRHSNAAGTGYNEGNPFSQFTRIGRQVNTDSLRVHLVDSTGHEISWNYAGHNNPYFAVLEDSNHAVRDHGVGSLSATYAFSDWLTGTASGGVDYYHDARLFTVRSGWMGGFPFFTGMGDFSKGWSEGDAIALQRTTALVGVEATRALSPAVRWNLGAGADLHTVKQRVFSAGVDSATEIPAAGAPDTAKISPALTWTAHSRVGAGFAHGGLSYRDAARASASLRDEWSSVVAGQHESTLYPSLQGSADLTKLLPSMRRGPLGRGAAVVRAEWWRAGNDLTSPYGIETLYAGRPLSGSIAPSGTGLLLADSALSPEVTTGWQVGADLSVLSQSVTLGITAYHERTSDVVLPVPDTVLHRVVARNAAQITNRGIETQLGARFGDGRYGFEWDVAGNAARNSNQVDQLALPSQAVALGPPQGGVTAQARQGEAFGVLTGFKLLRDSATGALLLRNGLPVADSAAGQQVLGNALPRWVLGLRSTLRYRWVSLSGLLDGRVGGSLFSMTNLWGSYAGNLEATAFRPDSGLLIVGLDQASRKANTQHVSTQNYYHALGAVQEPWVYSATYMKLREARLSVTLPTSFSYVPFSTATLSVIGRNLVTWTKVPNIDPELLLSQYQLPGVELGQLPLTRSVGVQLTISP